MLVVVEVDVKGYSGEGRRVILIGVAVVVVVLVEVEALIAATMVMVGSLGT